MVSDHEVSLRLMPPAAPAGLSPCVDRAPSAGGSRFAEAQARIVARLGAVLSAPERPCLRD